MCSPLPGALSKCRALRRILNDTLRRQEGRCHRTARPDCLYGSPERLRTIRLRYRHEGMFLHMNAPGNEQTWKQAHQRVIYLAMRTYETAKHCDAKKLQTNLVLLKNALDAEVRL